MPETLVPAHPGRPRRPVCDHELIAHRGWTRHEITTHLDPTPLYQAATTPGPNPATPRHDLIRVLLAETTGHIAAAQKMPTRRYLGLDTAPAPHILGAPHARAVNLAPRTKTPVWAHVVDAPVSIGDTVITVTAHRAFWAQITDVHGTWCGATIATTTRMKDTPEYQATLPCSHRPPEPYVDTRPTPTWTTLPGSEHDTAAEELALHHALATPSPGDPEHRAALAAGEDPGDEARLITATAFANHGAWTHPEVLAYLGDPDGHTAGAEPWWYLVRVHVAYTQNPKLPPTHRARLAALSRDPRRHP